MGFYPVMLELQGKPCLVVGGGRVAVRKVISLLRAGASVTVISPHFNKHFDRIKSRITLIERAFTSKDITKDITLVIGATNSNDINRLISQCAAACSIPCNIVDCAELSSFIVPAVVRKGKITIAVSSSGTSPRFSRYIKSRLIQMIGSEYSDVAEYLTEVRKRSQAEIQKSSVRFTFWEHLFETDPVKYIEQNGWSSFRNYVESLLIAYKQRVTDE